VRPLRPEIEALADAQLVPSLVHHKFDLTIENIAEFLTPVGCETFTGATWLDIVGIARE
jgi:hypothetical protein